MKIKGKNKELVLPSSIDNLKIGIVKASWNRLITETMLDQCIETLLAAGLKEDQLIIKSVPGSYELPLGALMIENGHSPDALICLGCVIKGSTDHDVFINQGIAEGIMNLSLRYSKPFIFGVLTVKTEKQAMERINGDVGNKGKESAETALEMIALQQQIKSERKGEIGFNTQRK